MRRSRAAAVLGVVGALVLSSACTTAPPTKTSSSTGTQTPTVAVSTGHFPPPPTTQLPADTAAALAKEVQRWVSTGLITGVTAAVVTPQGTWAGAAGVDGKGTPLTPTTGVALASVTKPFVAAEVMLLAQAGRIELAKPASTYVLLPQVANGATVADLLGMRSGLAQVEDASWVSLVTPPDRHVTVREALAAVGKPTGKPGTTYDYNNANYWVLGLVIEKVTGKPVARALRDDLATPHHLDRMAFQDQEALPEPLARPGSDPTTDLAPSRTGFVPWRAQASMAGAAGGIAADAPTVARFGYLLWGGQIVSPESVAQMTTFRNGYGLGTWDFHGSRLAVDAYGHLGELPGSRTALMVFPEVGVCVALLTPTGTEVAPYVKYLVQAGKLTSP